MKKTSFMIGLQKRLLRVFLLFCLLPIKSYSEGIKVLVGNTIADEEMSLNAIFPNDSIIMPFDGITKITGLAVDASITPQPEEEYLVRVLLQDENGDEYLILESYREINDADTIVFENYSLETSYLVPMSPKFIKIFVRNAMFLINSIKTSSYSAQSRNLLVPDYKIMQDSMRYKQVEEIVRSINEYNIENKKMWWAGVTPLSLKSYEERKRVLGMTDGTITGGLEYYEGGIFEVGNPEDNLSATMNAKEHSPYISHFDWRNRHGKNWMTPAKDQGNSGYCVPFAVASVAEAMINLYYNSLINFDLSEQNLAVCCGYPNPYYGMTYSVALNYIRDYGICDEETYPFVDRAGEICMSDEMSPEKHVRIAGYTKVGDIANDQIKKALIERGPLVSGFTTRSPGNLYPLDHAMTLVGYRVLEAGDSICEIVEYDTIKHSYGFREQFVLSENDYRIGMTCWIFKDNYPKSRTYENGYMYLLFHDSSFLNTTYSENLPFEIISDENYNVVCEDNDGDGYFWWGLGPKPSDIPSWAQEEPDGDDSNPQYGPMNEYGYIETISLLCPDIVVNTTTTWNEESYLYNNVRVVSGGILTITSNILKHPGSSITVESGGKLIVNGGIITRGNIVVKDNGELLITGGGEIRLSGSNNFNVEQGGIFNQSFGKIIIIG